MPNSSAATANTKSVWLSGRMRLTVPSPGPRPNQPPRRFTEQPGDQDHEGWFEKLRRLNVDTEDNDPAPRALDLGPVNQRGRDQCNAENENDKSNAPDMPRRQEGGRQHHRDRRDQV